MKALQRFIDPTIYTRFVVQLLIIMFLVEFVKGALLISILPVYMKENLALSAFIIGLTLALQYIGDNLFRSPIGWLIDKIGYRPSMLAGVILTFAAVIMIANLSHYVWISLACALLGIGTSPLWPCVITGATEVSGEKALGQTMSVIYMAWLGGVGLGPIIINLFIDPTYGRAFQFLIVIMCVVLLTALWLPGKSKIDENRERSQSNKYKSKLLRLLGQLRKKKIGDTFRNIKLYIKEANETLQVSRVIYPAMFAQTFALGLLIPVLTLYARTVLNLTPNQYSIFLVAGGAVTVISLIPVGKLVDTWGIRWFLVIGLLCASIALLVFTFVNSMSLLLVIVGFLGFGYALIIPSWNALLGSVIPEHRRGAIWGFFLTIEGSGTVFGSLISGKLWDSLGPHAPFIASGLVLLCLLVLQMFINIPKKVVVR